MKVIYPKGFDIEKMYTKANYPCDCTCNVKLNNKSSGQVSGNNEGECGCTCESGNQANKTANFTIANDK